jgi:hypothetical protein
VKMFTKKTHHQESRQLELCQYLTDWIICDSQPLIVVQSLAFKKLIFQLDPRFQIPNPKYIKKIVHQAYNYSKPLIIEKLKKDANAVSLTCDLWTGRNRQGFLGITCSYLDSEFQLHEIILSVQYIPYPHTAEHIEDTLLTILDEWELRDKVFIVTTDNGSNMRKAIKDLELITDNIMWQPCMAHTLQLVVGKGLKPIKALVGRTKRLIDFFMRPKQSECLEKIQKQFMQPTSSNEVVFNI